MHSIKGIFRGGKIYLQEPLPSTQESDLIITFLQERKNLQQSRNESSKVQAGSEQSETYYQTLRQHERHHANGEICITNEEGEISYSLYDYSAGGLSFVADIQFEVNQTITAAIHYTAAGEVLTLNFEIIVRRIFDHEGNFKIGCQFCDAVDEELWHTILG